MKTRYIFYAIGLAVLLGACASEKNDQNDLGYPVVENPEYGELQDTETPPFEFVLQDSITFDFPNDFILSSISYLNTDSQGILYFLETRQSKLISFSADGTFRWMTGQKGRGPGDFDRPTHLLAGEEYLYVVNMAGTRLDLFDFEGNFVRSIDLGKELLLPKLRGFTDNDQLVITTPLWRKIGSNVHITTIAEDSLIRQHHFALDRSDGREFGNGNTAGSGIVVEGNQLVLGSQTEYSVSRYDLDGNLISKVTRDFDRIVPPGYHEDGDDAMFTSFGGVEYLKALPTEHFLVFALWPGDKIDPNTQVRKRMEGNGDRIEFKHSIDLFNSDNTLMYSFEGEGLNLPQGTLEFISEDGFLFFTKENSTPVLYKYKLEQNI